MLPTRMQTTYQSLPGISCSKFFLHIVQFVMFNDIVVIFKILASRRI